MNNEIEVFVNLIFMTEYMKNILFEKGNGVENNKYVIELLDWNKYKDIQEIIDLNNEHINKAIQEMLDNKKMMEKLKENTNIDINSLVKYF